MYERTRASPEEYNKADHEIRPTPLQSSVRKPGAAMIASPGVPVSVVSAVTRREETPRAILRIPRTSPVQQKTAARESRSPTSVAAPSAAPRKVITSATPENESVTPAIIRIVILSSPNSPAATATTAGVIARINEAFAEVVFERPTENKLA